MALTDRQRVLGVLLLGVGVLTLTILSRVLETVFFAITVAYVLYPVRRVLVARGVSRRVAAGAATAFGFVFVVVVFTPIVVALYGRQEELLTFIREIPDELTFTVFGLTETIDVSQLLVQAREWVVSAGIGIAGEAPVIALKLFLFVILVYGLLVATERTRHAAMRIAPGEYHDVVVALHERVRDTLYALYVLQAATALGTFVVAYVVFWALGFDAAFSLAIFSGILQFIPVLGPSLLIALVAVGQAIAGDVVTAILVTVIGLMLVGFLPDAVIRPRLASVTTGMPMSLYFVGFVGGTLTLGVVGVIAGPLVVALLAEVVELLTDERTTTQGTLAETTRSLAETASGDGASIRGTAEPTDDVTGSGDDNVTDSDNSEATSSGDDDRADGSGSGVADVGSDRPADDGDDSPGDPDAADD